MSKTIEEAARDFVAIYYDLEEYGDEVSDIETDNSEECFIAGAEHVLSLPLSQRLTDEERERVRKEYAEAQSWLDEEPTSDSYNSCLRICAVTIQDRLESIFGKELFGEE